MKKIKDYLHLYIGCECEADGNRFKLAGVEVTDTGTLAYDGTMVNGIHQCWWIENCDFKIFLRPLSYMTEEELLYCVGICYDSVYGGKPEFIRTETVDPNDESAGIICEEPGWQYGLTISYSGVDFSANGSFLNFPEFEIVRYLLSQHLDIFNLINEGLAISKTTLK